MFALANKDAYKIGHGYMYPKKTTIVYSNLTPRTDKHFPIAKQSKYYDKKIVWFGLQRYIKVKLIKQWNNTFFNLPKKEVVNKYVLLVNQILGAGTVTTDHIGKLHDYGKLPIIIKSLPEGSRVNIGVPVLTIFNTRPEFSWVVNFLETSISQELWKPTTVATIADQYKQLLLDYANKTGVDPEFVNWQGHDFSARGMSCEEDAANSGIGHLTSFTGTDTVASILSASENYNMCLEDDLIGGSIPATEHAVMMMKGQEGELDTYSNLLDKFPVGNLSCVSDTWNLWNVLTNILPKLKDKIMSREGTLVIRPDSGNPVDIICGTGGFKLDNGKYRVFNGDPALRKTAWKDVNESEYKGVVELLWDEFGGTINDKGYKVLDSHVGAIYGDSITFNRAKQILQRLEAKGFASSNIVFGIGSFTYQYITRDTLGMAIKATYAIIDDKPIDMFKDPITDDGTKKSAKGLLRVENNGSDFILHDCQTLEQTETNNALVPVFDNGKLLVDESLTTIRNRLK